MPIWLRKFTFKKCQEFYRAQEKVNKAQTSNTAVDLSTPDKSKFPPKKTITPPSYIAKASRK